MKEKPENTELRMYAFNNMYLSHIAAGIQTAHTIAEMCADYLPSLGGGMRSGDAVMLHEWARNHKTIIVLNGGMQSDLEDMYEFLSSTENSYPFGKFHEEQAALNGALTNVGVILPDYIFKYKQWVKEKEEDGFGYVPTLTEWELVLVDRMSKCHLMN